jgi:hypothetical protein
MSPTTALTRALVLAITAPDQARADRARVARGSLRCVEESEEFDKPNGPKLSVKIRALLAQAEGNA